MKCRHESRLLNHTAENRISENERHGCGGRDASEARPPSGAKVQEAVAATLPLPKLPGGPPPWPFKTNLDFKRDRFPPLLLTATPAVNPSLSH